jgi:hypothetical protein
MSIAKYVMTKGKHWSGLTTRNHLGSIYQSKPQVASKITGVLLQSAGMKNLDTVLNQFPVKYIDDEGDFTWKLVGAHERNIPLLRAEVGGVEIADSTTAVGAGRSVIDLIFPEKWFTDVHVIAGNKPDLYQYRILADPEQIAVNEYKYSVEIWGGSETLLGVPGAELQAGEKFSIEGAPVERTMSIKGADINFSSPFVLKNTISQLRVEHTMPGNMINYKQNNNDILFANIESVDNAGKKHVSTVWQQEVFWRFEQHVSRLKAYTTMFGKSNRAEDGEFLNTGKSGFKIEAGSGIREQMDVSNVVLYNTFSLGALEDMLHNLSEGKIDFAERKFVLRTGERGAAQFSRAIDADGTAWNKVNATNPATIRTTNSPLHSNALKGGYQFTEYEFANSIHVMVEVDPMYDDKVRNKIQHPLGGVAESYRYDILYMGSEEEPNIQKVSVTGMEDIRDYQSGFRNPFTGQVGGGNMGRMEDSATMTGYCMLGAMVKDPSRTASLVPTILYQY